MSEPSSQVQTATMCICLPLRLGVMIAALATCVTSLFYVVDWTFSGNLFLHYTGGYRLGSRIVVSSIEVSGIFFGFAGVMGAYYARQRYVHVFNVWQFFRLAAWGVMYYMDLPLIFKCEEWVNNVEGMTASYGWNRVQYGNAVAGMCGRERMYFLVCSILTFLVFAYVVWATTKLHDSLSNLPKHLLRVPKDITSGAFFSHSPGERSYLNGMWGKSEQPGMP